MYPPVNVYITNWEDPPFLRGKSTISMANFNSKQLVYQRCNGHLFIGILLSGTIYIYSSYGFISYYILLTTIDPVFI